MARRGTIGAHVEADGEREFRESIKRIEQSVKTLGTEAKKVASQYDASDKSVEALSARNDVLNKRIDEQKRYVDELSKALKNAEDVYGKDSDQVQKWTQKLNNAEADLNKLTRELRTNVEEIKKQSGEYDEASKAAEEFAEETGKASKASQAFGVAAKGAGIAIGVVTAAVAACTAAAAKLGKAFVSMTTEGATYADTVLTQATVTGIATDKLQEYMYAAELVDVSTETLTGAMAKNIRSMNSAREGTGNAARAYDRLGVSVTKQNGQLRDSEEVFAQVIDALGKVKNETERDALAMEIFGKSAQELNPLIIAGSGALAEYAKQAREAGAVLDEKTLKAYGKLDDQLQRLKNGAQAAKNALGQVFLPVLTSLATDGVDALGRITKAINDANGDVQKISQNVSAVIPDVVAKIKQRLPEILAVVKPAISGVLQLIAQSVPQIVRAVSEIFPEISDSILDALPELLDTIGDVLVNVAQNLPVDKIVNIGATAVFKLIEKLPQIVEPLMKKIPDVITSLTSELSKPANIKMLLNGVVGTITSVLSNTPQIVKAITDAVPEIIDGILDTLTDGSFMFNLVKDLGKSIGKIILDGITFGIDSDDGWREIGYKITSRLSPVLGWLWKTIVGEDSAMTTTELSGGGHSRSFGSGIGGSYDTTDAGTSLNSATATELSAHMRNQNRLLQKIADKETVVTIGDDAVGQAQQRYNQSRGRILNKGVYANAY